MSDPSDLHSPHYKKDIAGMGQKLSQQQKSELREAFQLFDQDGDGTISTEELQIVLNSIGQGLTLEQIEIMITEVDADGNGQCSYDEFMDLMASQL